MYNAQSREGSYRAVRNFRERASEGNRHNVRYFMCLMRRREVQKRRDPVGTVRLPSYADDGETI